MEPSALLLGAADRPPRGVPAHPVQGRVHRLRVGRRRREPRLREHPVPRAAGVLSRPAVGRARRLGGGDAPALRHRRADARSRRLRGHDPCRRAAARVRRRARRRRHVQANPGRRVLRRSGPRGPGPLLRRRGAPADRVRALRELHGRLPPRRQEHAGEELPVVRGAARRSGAARAPRDGDPPYRRAGWLGRLRGHERALGRVAAPRTAHDDRPGSRGRRRAARHEPAARRLQARESAPSPLATPRRGRAHQHGVDPGGDRPG